jgi:hypothetical protein
MTTTVLPSMQTFANGVSVAFATRGDAFLGLGAVTAGGVALRNAARPLFVEIRNPNGMELCDYTVAGVRQDGEALTLDLAASLREGGMMEWMVHEVRNRYALADWTREPQPAGDTRLSLTLRPVTRRLRDVTYTGFSYQYAYHSPEVPIYKIFDRGTWEIGGAAVGNTFWMRNCFTPSRVPITSVDQFHSTEWFLPGCANPSVFQFAPLQTELQGFTFTTAEAGTLITWATEAAHIRSLFEKPRGADLLVHAHEHCGDLGAAFATAPVEVLWAAGPADATEQINRYLAMRELVAETLHADIGMARERITTYGQIEEWELPDMEHYRKNGLPKVLDAGCKTVYIANHFENNMNTYDCSNMCCTVDYRVAETVGEDKLTAFCRDAQAGGARVEMWGNTSVSTLTVIFDFIGRHKGGAGRVRFRERAGTIADALKATKDPWVRNPSNAIEADHYTPVFAVMNLRDDVVRDYWMRAWSYAHDQVGLEGIFLDSSFNLSSDKFHYVQNTEADSHGGTADQTHLLGHYRPAKPLQQAILSQYRAHLTLMAAMQRAGIHYCSEDLGVFGTHRHGPGAEKRLDTLFMWNECIAGFDVPALQKIGADLDDVFFRGLAYRQMWSLYWDPHRDRMSWNYGHWRDDYDTPSDAHLALLRAFTAVTDDMVNPEVLPGEAGVLYRGTAQVLWAFTDLTLALDGPTPVTDVLAGTTETVRTLEATARRVYRIG